jgi:hypothetical protein
MITTTAEFKEYFKALSPYDDDTILQNGIGSIKALGTFHFGDEDRILEVIKSKAVFPILWMDQFEISLAYNGGTKLRKVPVSLVIYHHSELHNFESEDDAQELCSEIALDIISKLELDHGNYDVQVDLDSFTMRPVYHRFDANLFGYELSFGMYLDLDTCYNPLKWN